MEVLTIVLQQLMEQKDIPLLMMRTVIQSVSIYPGLVGFIMNILQRLIVKQVPLNYLTWNTLNTLQNWPIFDCFECSFVE